MLDIEVRVVVRRQEAEGVCSFLLERTDSQELPAYTAGAHIDVEIRPGLVRQYSLCGDSQDRHSWRIGVLNEPQSRGGSRAVHELIHEGSTLRVSAPRNHFGLVDAPHTVLLAGGIGITPILAMANELQRHGRSFELHYCTRNAERTAFINEVNAPSMARVATLYHDDGATRKFEVASALASAPQDAHLYVCGPAGFIEHVLSAARSRLWSEERLHREHFSPVPTSKMGDNSFEVKLARSGSSYRIPADCSVLNVLLDAGVDVPASCESGVCGTCLTRVLDGTPDHRDSFMTDAEHAANDQFTPCCSRAKTPLLVLDL